MQDYIENRFGLKNRRILGVDEAGRGNWAGEMVVAGCILYWQDLSPEIIAQIDDSKKLTKTKRTFLFNFLKQHSAWDYVVIESKTIDQLGPKKAAILGMQQVIKLLCKECDYIFVDYEQPINIQKLLSLKHGDALSLNIAAASIIAKHIKDCRMQEWLNLNPRLQVYDFINNAGYGTKKHQLALNQYGKVPCFHRFSYAPIKKITKVNNLKLVFPRTSFK